MNISQRIVGVLGVASFLLLSSCVHSRPCPVENAAADRRVADSALLAEDGGATLDAWIESAVLARPDKPVDLLALSGGGLFGAYGAGFLNGWPDKPEFAVVTGISTGALQSVFAFLGREYDLKLKESYYGRTRDDVFRNRPLLLVPFSKSITSVKGLEKLIECAVTEEVIRDIAAAASSGRLLLVGTANLDRGRLEIWNMTEMAAQIVAEPPCADIERFRSVLLAAAAVPVAAPPVFIDGYMHVDGGARAQIFMQAVAESVSRVMDQPSVMVAAQDRGKPSLYAIANGYVGLRDEGCIKNSIISVGHRSILSVLDANMVGDMHALERFAEVCRGEDSKYSFRFTRVPDAYKPLPKFERPDDTIALFEFGEKAGAAQQWENEIPDTARLVDVCPGK